MAKVTNKGTHIEVQTVDWDILMKTFVPMFMQTLEKARERQREKEQQNEKWVDMPLPEKERWKKTYGEEAIRKQFKLDRKEPIPMGPGSASAETAYQQSAATQKTLPAVTAGTIAGANKIVGEAEEFLSPEQKAARAAQTGATTAKAGVETTQAGLASGFLGGTDKSLQAGMAAGMTPQAWLLNQMLQANPDIAQEVASLQFDVGPEAEKRRRERRGEQILQSFGAAALAKPDVQAYLQTGDTTKLANADIKSFVEQNLAMDKQRLDLAWTQHRLTEKQMRQESLAKAIGVIGEENADYAPDVVKFLETGVMNERAKLALGVVGDDSARGRELKRQLAESTLQLKNATVMSKIRLLQEDAMGLSTLIKAAQSCGGGTGSETCRDRYANAIYKQIEKQYPQLLTPEQKESTILGIAGTVVGAGTAELAIRGLVAVTGKGGTWGRIVGLPLGAWIGSQLTSAYEQSAMLVDAQSQAEASEQAVALGPTVLLDGVQRPLNATTADSIIADIDRKVQQIDAQMTIYKDDPVKIESLTQRLRVLQAQYEQAKQVKGTK